MPRQVPWPRIFAEGLAIVVSILLAFGIQAWWENRQDRQEERNLLAALLVDLRDDSTDYASALRGLERRVLAADLLLHLAGDPAASEGASATDMTAAAAFNQLGFSPRLETVRVSYDQITAAGISEVISDPDLRGRITRYYAVTADLTQPLGINAETQADNRAFEAELNRLGYTYSDGDRIPTAEVLADPTFLAVIRRSRGTSEFASTRGIRLLRLVVELIDQVDLYVR